MEKKYEYFILIDSFINDNYNKLTKEQYEYLIQILEYIKNLIIEG